MRFTVYTYSGGYNPWHQGALVELYKDEIDIIVDHTIRRLVNTIDTNETLIFLFLYYNTPLLFKTIPVQGPYQHFLCNLYYY